MKNRRLANLFWLICVGAIAYLLYQFILDQRRLTWGDYMKVRDGMTQAQIEAVLGPPTNVSALPNGSMQVDWFGRKEGLIQVTFDENGAMMRKCYTECACDYRLSFFPRTRD